MLLLLCLFVHNLSELSTSNEDLNSLEQEQTREHGDTNMAFVQTDTQLDTETDAEAEAEAETETKTETETETEMDNENENKKDVKPETSMWGKITNWWNNCK